MTEPQTIDELWAWIVARRLARQIEDEERHGDYEFKDGYGED